ncbi:MAG: hypothetical protein KatS3mg008_2150 [Acidimicrobiales bacterium]|nr:MAG: hypothetical protein KatS3mg008_2150 [Acidimicrobiales bacterium]
MKNSRRRRPLVVATSSIVAMSLLLAACGSDEEATDEAATTETTEQAATGPKTTEAPEAEAASTDTKAAELRAALTDLLTEHVFLASMATDAALRGDQAAFEAYAGALNGDDESSNTERIVAAVASAYGDEVGQAFEGLWRAEGHIPAFVEYTQAVAAGDEAGKKAALDKLTAYAAEFGKTLESVNENLKAETVEEGVVMHAETLIAVIDAQAKKDWPAAYSALRKAYSHMADLASAIAGATVAKFPDGFDGEADSPGADLRAGLHSLLREHVWLAASATDAALGGRQDQFEAAAAALNGPSESNTADIVAAVRSVYGDEVGQAFEGLWRAEGHIPAFVEYTQAVAAGDEAGKKAALDKLTAYAAEFGKTLESVNENLPADVVEESLVMHAETLIAVIEAQKAGNPADVAGKLREAVDHMSKTADALASATAKKFPDKF